MITLPGNGETTSQRFSIFMLKIELCECSFQHKIKSRP